MFRRSDWYLAISHVISALLIDPEGLPAQIHWRNNQSAIDGRALIQEISLSFYTIFKSHGNEHSIIREQPEENVFRARH